MEWLQENMLVILAILGLVSEIVALTPLKSNSIVQLIMNMIKWLGENLKAKE